MGLFDRWRTPSTPLTAEIPGGIVQRTFQTPDPVNKFYADMGSGLLAASIYAEAASPFTSVSAKTAEVFIDHTIYRMMVASEKMLERNGDVQEGIEAQIDLASGA